MLWLADQPASPDAAREHVIPTGEMHLVFRLSDHPLRLFHDDDDAVGHIVGAAIVAGPRSTFHVKDVSTPVRSVGVQLYPWTAEALFGAPPDELAGRHLALEEVWGGAALRTREQLQEAPGPELQLDILEGVLAERLARVRRVHPAAAEAIERFRATSSVSDVVRASGYSHRALVALFKRAVGLAPKRYCRVLRFQRVLRRIAANRHTRWTEIALAAGYSDQPHFVREFREFTGVTPEAYLKVFSGATHHVKVNFLQDGAGRSR